MMEQTQALVLRAYSKKYLCYIFKLKKEIYATARPELIRKKSQGIVVGDYVCLEEKRETYNIVSVDERRNQIFRYIQRERAKKIQASNVDFLVLVSSLTHPKYKSGIVERFYLRSLQWGIPLLHIFNKADLYQEDEEINLFEESLRLKKMGIESFEISSKQPDYNCRYLKNGISELKLRLKDKVSVFLGQSGVGKSKLINSLTLGKYELISSEIGKAQKGTHTTTWSRLYQFDQFSLIDSPGIRSMSLSDLTVDDLISFYPEIMESSLKCHFNNCEHEQRSKKCFFQSLSLNNEEEKYLLDRLESFKKMKEEIVEGKEKKFR